MRSYTHSPVQPRLPLLCGFLILMACDRGTDHPAKGSQPPTGWSAIEAATVFPDVYEDTARFLKWEIVHVPHSVKPRVLHRAIICGRVSSRYFLAHVFRHPEEKYGRWRPSKVDDAPDQTALQEYEIAPSQHELDLFLKATWWKTEFTPVSSGSDSLSNCWPNP